MGQLLSIKGGDGSTTSAYVSWAVVVVNLITVGCMVIALIHETNSWLRRKTRKLAFLRDSCVAGAKALRCMTSTRHSNPPIV